MQVKFVPQLMPLDRITATYKTERYKGEDLWGYANWGEGVWGERLGYNINLDALECKILKLKHNIDKFTTDIVAREI